MKKFLVVLLVLVISIATVFAEGTNEKVSSDSYKVGFIVGSRQHVFYNLIEEGINSKAAELGIEAVVLDGQLDGNVFSDHINNLVAENCDAIALSCNDPGGVTPALEAADRDGVPVFTFDCTTTTTDVVKCFVGTDNFAGGYLAGQYAAKIAPEGAKVAAIWDVPQSCVDRYNGWIKAIKESNKNLKMIDVGQYHGDASKAENLMTDALTSNPDINSVFCGGDPAATGALAAVKASGASTKVIGFDGNPESKAAMLDSINGKYWVAEVAQDPVGIGKQITEQIYKYLTTGSVEKKVIMVNPYIFTAADL